MKRTIQIFVFFLIVNELFGHNIDSLHRVLPNAKGEKKIEVLLQLSDALNDSLTIAIEYAHQASDLVKDESPTYKVKVIYQLAELYYNAKLYDSSLYYLETLAPWVGNSDMDWYLKAGLLRAHSLRAVKKFDEALKTLDQLRNVAVENGTLRQQQEVYELSINCSFKLSNLDKTHVLIFEKLLIDSVLNDSIHLGEDYNNLSTIHRKQGKYSDALGFSQKALEIFEMINNTEGLASAYNSLGGIYYYTDDYKQAIRHFSKAVELYVKSGDESILPGVYNNMGSVYNELKDYNKALEFYNKSRELYKKQNNQYAEAILTGNMGLVSIGLGDLKKAEEFFVNSLRLQESINNTEGILHAYSNLGGLFLKKSNYKTSEIHYEKALKMAVEGDYPYEKLNITKEMVDLKKAQGNFEEALQLYQQHVALKDSLQNQESTEQLNAFQAQLDLKEHQNQIEILNKENEIAKEKIKRQQLISIGGIVVAFLLLCVVVAVFIALKISRKAKQKLEVKNHEIQRQHEIIQFKNKQLTDSISYAGRVQKALFSPLKNIEVYMFDFFITTKPQNLVSGDFFWYKETDSRLYLALADCTGHGVPGAFMSILGNTLLNEVVNEQCTKETHEVLNELRQKVKISLHQKNLQGNTDGMDISVCSISKASLTMQFSGANNSIFRIRENQIEEFKADKMPVGVSMKETSFTHKDIPFQKGDWFYLSSDGFFDQFNEKGNEKITRKNFKTLLLQINPLNGNHQKEELNRFFEDWKKSAEQTDDMMVVGFQIL